MSFRTSVTIVASPRPRIGKTLLARVLTDFQRHEGRAVAAYDLNGGEGTLRKFLPQQATAARVDDIKGQMALFDALVAPDDVNRVVDLGHASFEAFFTIAEQIGFVEEALSRGIAPAVLFVLTPDRTSVDAFQSLRRRFPGLTLAPVHNEIFGATQYADRYALRFGDRLVRLPALAAGARKFAEVPPFSFNDVGRARLMPPEALEELQHWLRKIYLEFRELDLRVLLADLQSAITLGG